MQMQGQLGPDRISAPWRARATLVLGLLVGVLPLGLPARERPFIMLLAATVIFFWGAQSRTSLGAPFVFAAGLAADLLTGGPLGYHPVAYLVVLALARFSAERGVARSLLGQWLAFATAMAVTVLVAWAMAGFYALTVVPLVPFGETLLIAFLIYPLVAALLGLLARVGTPNPAREA